MTNISALDYLKAAVSASDTITRQSESSVDFSSFLKTDKNLEEIYAEASVTYGVPVDLLKAMPKSLTPRYRVPPSALSNAQSSFMISIV